VIHDNTAQVVPFHQATAISKWTAPIEMQIGLGEAAN